MALPSKNLPFEYTDRWAQIGDLFVPERLSSELVNKLDKRDKDLEDYLANVPSGGGLNSTTLSAFATIEIPANSGKELTGWVDRESTGSGSSWPLTDTGTMAYLDVPQGLYLVSLSVRVFGVVGPSEFAEFFVGVESMVDTRVSTARSNGDDAEYELCASVLAVSYSGPSEGEITPYARVTSSPGIDPQEVRDRYWTVIQLGTT